MVCRDIFRDMALIVVNGVLVLLLQLRLQTTMLLMPRRTHNFGAHALPQLTYRNVDGLSHISPVLLSPGDILVGFTDSRNRDSDPLQEDFTRRVVGTEFVNSTAQRREVCSMTETDLFVNIHVKRANDNRTSVVVLHKDDTVRVVPGDKTDVVLAALGGYGKMSASYVWRTIAGKW